MDFRGILPPLFDTHCHLDDPRFDSDRASVWDRAEAAGVRFALIPGTEPARWTGTLAVCQPGKRVAALGVHPHALASLEDGTVRDALNTLADLRRAHLASLVAVGEVGFDGGIDPVRASPARQARVFAWHAEVAVALGLPLVVHVLRAHELALRTLRALTLPRPAGVIHSYSGPAELVPAYESLGFSLSFAGSITRPTARRPALAARAVDPARLLVETDAPDQPPTGIPRELTRCEPAHLPLVCAALARARSEAEGALRALTERNARALFGLA
jgi:TatD DNase family protein